MAEVHLRIVPGQYACGLENRWGSQVISSTEHKMAVTCERCRATQTFAHATQRIPLLPPLGYRHAPQ